MPDSSSRCGVPIAPAETMTSSASMRPAPFGPSTRTPVARRPSRTTRRTTVRGRISRLGESGRPASGTPVRGPQRIRSSWLNGRGPRPWRPGRCGRGHGHTRPRRMPPRMPRCVATHSSGGQTRTRNSRSASRRAVGRVHCRPLDSRARRPPSQRAISSGSPRRKIWPLIAPDPPTRRPRGTAISPLVASPWPSRPNRGRAVRRGSRIRPSRSGPSPASSPDPGSRAPPRA